MPKRFEDLPKFEEFKEDYRKITVKFKEFVQVFTIPNRYEDVKDAYLLPRPAYLEFLKD